MAIRFCTEDGCTGVASTGSYCPLHIQPSTRTSTRERHVNDRFYARAAWKGPYGVRAYKWRRNPICEYVAANGTKCTHATEAFTISMALGKRQATGRFPRRQRDT